MVYTDEQLLFKLFGYGDAMSDFRIILGMPGFYLEIMRYCKNMADDLLQADRVFKEYVKSCGQDGLVFDIETDEIFYSE